MTGRERADAVPGRRVRRAGLMTLACLFGTGSAALTLAWYRHLGVAGTLVQFLVGGGALASLYLAWETYRSASLQGEAILSTEQMADELAVAVGDLWETEARSWRIYDPHPLPVRWVAADASLVDTWDQLKTLASNWPGETSSSSAWGDRPSDLAGNGNQLAGILARVPTGRLVILGDPGAGKTVLMVRLILDLLARRAPGSTVPVLLSIASWNPEEDRDLHQWIISALSADYPAHATPASTGGPGRRSRIQTLVTGGCILPILDGLDEIPDALQALAISAINDSVRPGEQFILTSRTDAYARAVRPDWGTEITLRGATAVLLCPLDTEAVATYLRTDAGGPSGAARWDPVLARLGADGPIAEVLSNPLMVALARTLYNPRPDYNSRNPPSPMTLCRFTDADKLRDHLFDAFIPAVYRARSGDIARRSWPSSAQAEHWLTFLAHHLEDTVKVPNFAWWYLGEDPSAKRLARVLGIVVYGLRIGTVLAAIGAAIAAVVLALPHLGLRWHPGFPIFVHATAPWQLTTTGKWLLTGSVWYVIGAFLATAFGQRFGYLDPPRGRTGPLYGPRWNLRLRIPLAAGVGLAIGLLIWLVAGFRPGLGYGVAIGLLVALIGLERRPSDLAVASPKALLTRDRRATLNTWPPIVLVIGVSAGIVAGFTGALVGLGPGVGHGLLAAVAAALGTMVFIAPVSTFNQPSWLNWLLARNWLALRRRLPWRLMKFLADAHSLGLLRQAGPVYQFRHIELQRRLGHHVGS